MMERLNNIFLVLYLLFLNICLLMADYEPKNISENKIQEPSKVEKIFKAGFLEARLQHIEALKHIRKTMNYEKQYKLTYSVFQKLFDVLRTSKIALESSDYIPGLDFPTNHTTMEALGQLLDNTALYGEFQLKLPDITDRIMKTQNEWTVLIKWAIGFSNSTGLFDSKTSTMLNLVCQEMNLTERAENFVNPYRKLESKTLPLKQKEDDKKKKKNFKKGPRMSKPFHTEL